MKNDVIRSFGDQATADVFSGEHSKQARQRLPVELHEKARSILEALDKIEKLIDLKQYDIKRMKGERSDQYSLRINRQYRICFQWIDGEAHYVQILDYH